MPPRGRAGSAGTAVQRSSASERTESCRASVGGVLGLDLLASDRGEGVVCGDRGLAHADRDQGDLARVAGDVARRVDAGDVRLAGHRFDPDLALALELEAPIGDRAEVRVEAEQRDQRLTRDLLALAGL